MPVEAAGAGPATAGPDLPVMLATPMTPPIPTAATAAHAATRARCGVCWRKRVGGVACAVTGADSAVSATAGRWRWRRRHGLPGTSSGLGACLRSAGGGRADPCGRRYPAGTERSARTGDRASGGHHGQLDRSRLYTWSGSRAQATSDSLRPTSAASHSLAAGLCVGLRAPSTNAARKYRCSVSGSTANGVASRAGLSRGSPAWDHNPSFASTFSAGRSPGPFHSPRKGCSPSSSRCSSTAREKMSLLLVRSVPDSKACRSSGAVDPSPRARQGNCLPDPRS